VVAEEAVFYVGFLFAGIGGGFHDPYEQSVLKNASLSRTRAKAALLPVRDIGAALKKPRKSVSQSPLL